MSRLIRLTLLAALLSGCGGSGPRDPETCSDAPDTVELTELRASASITTGGQGLSMGRVGVTWIGEDLPDCLRAVINGEVYELATDPVEGGRRSRSSVYEVLGSGRFCSYTARVQSYGLEDRAFGTAPSCGFDASGPRPDAGPLDGSVLDGDVLDGDVLDGDVLDGDVLDGDVLDGAVLDGDVLDGAVLDGDVLDGSALDAAVLDGSALDAAGT